MKSDIIEGLQIVGFYSNSQLAERGVKEGDWIIEYNGEKVTSKAQLQELKLKFQNSNNIVLKIRRGDVEEYFQIWPGDLGIYLAEREKNPDILPNAKRIENINRLEKRTGIENTFFGSLINILKVFEVEINLTTLMGLSAFPFRIQFHESWTTDILDPTKGFDCAKFLFDNLNIKYKKIENGSTPEHINKAIICSIDKRIPVLAKNLYGKNEWGIITGYQNQGKGIFCRSYSDKTIDYSLATQNPDCIIIFETKPKTFESDDMLQFEKPKINSLEAAKNMLSTEIFGGYLIGNFAINKWINILENNDYFNSLTDKKFRKICINNNLLFEKYSFNFLIASDYLESFIEIFPDSREHLKRLCKFYKAEGKILHDCQKFIPINSNEDLRNFFTQQFRNNQVIALIKIQKKNNEILTIMEKLPLFK
ncbi:MAG: PDZ domain-containing protein [Candidatus Cloacimonetes bacterium]|nr:PDZ domain-containing protein [Candidatus Cloacimonadota bacterium]